MGLFIAKTLYFNFFIRGPTKVPLLRHDLVPWGGLGYTFKR